MSDKELNTPMNREQFETPRELTSEELDIVTGGGGVGGGRMPPPPPTVRVNPEDGNNQGENNQGTTSVVLL
jgi:hypothetical protein